MDARAHRRFPDLAVVYWRKAMMRILPRGRPHREVILGRRRCSLSFMISLKSATGRISIGLSPYLKLAERHDRGLAPQGFAF